MRPARQTSEATEDRPRAMTEVLGAAAECFMEMGFAATSIDDVARRMGATKGRVYHYYRSKADLFFDVYRYSLERIQSPVAAIAAEDRPARERFRDMVRAHALSIMEDQTFHRVASQGVEMLARGATTPDQRKALADLIRSRARHEEMFREVMVEGRDAGVMSFGDPTVTVKALLAGLNGLVYWYRPGGGESRKSRDEIADEMERFAMKCVALERNMEPEETQ